MNAAPSHVPENLVIDFNIYNDQRLAGDLHLALKQMHADLPDIFWTPQNGGHWVVTRYSLIEEICTDHDHFSARGNHVPFDPDGMVMIPLNLDPPEHTVYRNILLKYFGPAAIRKLEPRVQSWAGRLIDNVVDKGECDFMAEVGLALSGLDFYGNDGAATRPAPRVPRRCRRVLRRSHARTMGGIATADQSVH